MIKKEITSDNAKYGVFTYEKTFDTMGNEMDADCIEMGYYNNKTKAITYARESFKDATPRDNYFIEVWKANKDGLWGNCGTPIYKSDRTPKLML